MPQDSNISRFAPSTAPAVRFQSRPFMWSDPADRTLRFETATALALLAAGGCPACRFVTNRQERFFLWFTLEHYREQETIKRLEAALGLCPKHCRALISLRVYPGTLTNVYIYAVRAVLARLRGEGADGVCVGCEHERWASEHVIEIVGKTIVDERVAISYRNVGGFCGSRPGAGAPFSRSRDF